MENIKNTELNDMQNINFLYLSNKNINQDEIFNDTNSYIVELEPVYSSYPFFKKVFYGHNTSIVFPFSDYLFFNNIRNITYHKDYLAGNSGLNIISSELLKMFTKRKITSKDGIDNINIINGNIFNLYNCMKDYISDYSLNDLNINIDTNIPIMKEISNLITISNYKKVHQNCNLDELFNILNSKASSDLVISDYTGLPLDLSGNESSPYSYNDKNILVTSAYQLAQPFSDPIVFIVNCIYVIPEPLNSSKKYIISRWPFVVNFDNVVVLGDHTPGRYVIDNLKYDLSNNNLHSELLQYVPHLNLVLADTKIGTITRYNADKYYVISS